MDGYPAASVTPYNGQPGDTIGPIKFETEPYHYDVSNNQIYSSAGTYVPNQYEQPSFECTSSTQAPGMPGSQSQAQAVYVGQQNNESIQHSDTNGETLQTINNIKNHQSTPGTVHHCDLCDKAFSSNASMRRHREIHTGLKKFSCELCGNSYTQKHNLTKHMRQHTGEKPYKCHLCEKSFYIHHHLKNHVFQHTGEQPYRCIKCNKSFKHKVRYERHVLSHEQTVHSAGSVAETPPSVVTSEDNSMSEVWNGLDNDDAEDMYDDDDDGLDNSMYDSYEEGNKYDEQECEVCQQIFINKESLDNHFKLRHAVEHEFKCDECSSIFLSRVHLVRHRRTHTGEQIYECEECNVSFRFKVSLHIHMRRHNNDYRRYECTLCNKYFLAKESLKKHTNMHLGGMTTYECDECDDKFTQKSEYKNHLQSHVEGGESKGDGVGDDVGDGGEGGGGGGQNQAKPTCKTCHKTFSSNSSLRKHEFTHMDVKPHKCELCNVSFAQKIQLRLHNKKHNGGKMDPPLFYRPKKDKDNQTKKAESDDSDTKSDNSPARRRSPAKVSSPVVKIDSSPLKVAPVKITTSPKTTSQAKVSPVRIKIDRSKIIPERRNAPRKARNVIKEDEEEEDEDDEEESTEEEAESEMESEPEEGETKKSRWEGYRYPVCENCNQIFKKRSALTRHQKKCKKRD